MTITFECNDCDTVVFSAGPTHDPNRRCAACQIIAEQVNPAQREQMRTYFAKIGMIGAPRPRAAVAAYADPSCPERACDGCGRAYRGPAIFCCLSCALGDA